MADEAFALSPISASGILPSQTDYDAISEAFMETARGRWFLNEYAKRNRNADTSMVLDAVARIERSLAVQKDPLPDGVPDILAAVSAIVTAARANLESALAGPLLDDALASPKKSARVIREIAWGLRESGADGRICGLLDAQVDVINGACEDFATGGLRDEILQMFDHALKLIADLAGGDAALTSTKTVQPFSPTVASREPQQPPKAYVVAVEATVSVSPEPIIASPVVAVAQPLQPAPVNVSGHLNAALGPTLGSSLGATLIASGIVAKPAAPRSDLLAPIRRMSSAEKIAFFS